MGGFLFDSFTGSRIIVQWEHDDGEPKRKHKKKRIAKKWLKRYGTWSSPCKKGQIFWFNDFTSGSLEKRFYVSRNTYAMLKDYARHRPKISDWEECGHHGNSFS